MNHAENTRRPTATPTTSAVEATTAAAADVSGVRRIVSQCEERSAAKIFMNGWWYSARTIQTAGLVECPTPTEFLKVDSTGNSAQTEAVLMREEFGTAMTETVEDITSGIRTVRQTKSTGVREPGDVLWRTWNRGGLPTTDN